MPRPFTRVVTIPAGATWPDCEGGVAVPSFSWLHIENRGAALSDTTLNVSWLGPAQGEKPHIIIPAGESVTCDVAGVHDPAADTLHVKNISAGTAVDAFITISDSPIHFVRNRLTG